MTKGKLYLVPTPIGNLEDMTFRAIRILKEADVILAEDTRTSAPIFMQQAPKTINMTKGKLYLVPTPIGNLEDMTFRAIRILKEADVILAEDTRTSAPMLKHFGIDKKAYSHHQHNEHKATSEIIKFLEQGKNVALISDAGTPAISDPGFFLVREALKNGLEVNCLPGATAFVPALVNSGLPSDQFIFEGFLPVKKGRQTRLKLLATEERTMIFYESPHRLLKTLEEFALFLGEDRQASVSRELTKIFEETIRGTLLEIKSHFENNILKGEIVICVAGAEQIVKPKNKYHKKDENE